MARIIKCYTRKHLFNTKQDNNGGTKEQRGQNIQRKDSRHTRGLLPGALCVAPEFARTELLGPPRGPGRVMEIDASKWTVSTTTSLSLESFPDPSRNKTKL